MLKRRQARGWPIAHIADGLLAVLAVSLFPSPAYAYIDPGTGSALLYLITGIALSVYFGARALYYRLGELAFRSKHKQQSCEIAIHSEDPRYEITFLPIINALAAEGTQVSYFTMYERDESFAALPEGTTHLAIAPGMLGYSLLNTVEAKLFLTTTPQLDIMTFRRSKRVQHYCYVPHALGESRYVRPYSYDYFDSVMCCGRIIKANIRKMESIRNSSKKQLFETGVPHYDELLDRANVAQDKESETTILIAPSWGPLSLFECFGTDFIQKIAAKYKVIVRPHPQLKTSSKALYEEILNLKNVEVDTARTPATAMAKADLLVSDLSGIMHEFSFIHQKPVLIVDRNVEVGGLEGELLGGQSELKEACRSVIVPIPAQAIDTIDEKIAETLKEVSLEKVATIRDDLVYNFGNAGPVAAQQIQGLLQCM